MACVTVDGESHFGAIYRPFTNETFFGMVGYGLMDSQGRRIDPIPENEVQRKIVVSRSHAGEVEKLATKVFGPSENVEDKEPYRVEPAGGSGYKTLKLVNGSAGKSYESLMRVL